MNDMFSREERSKIMSKIRSWGNAATELRFIDILKNNKISGWRRHMKLPGKPDFVFPSQKLVVFIDGDFWHGNPRKYRSPQSNSEYWKQKILSNQRRDRRINRLLRAKGWKVFRFWQSNLKNEVTVIAKLSRGLR